MDARVDGSRRAQLREEELDDMLRLSPHLLADLGDVGEDGALRAITVHARRRDGLLLAGAGAERGMRLVQQAEEAPEQLDVLVVARGLLQPELLLGRDLGRRLGLVRLIRPERVLALRLVIRGRVDLIVRARRRALGQLELLLEAARSVAQAYGLRTPPCRTPSSWTCPSSS